jgi:hypothetical protein
MSKWNVVPAAALTALAISCTPPNGETDAGPAAGSCELESDCPDDGRPEKRSELDAVYDDVNERMIVFGGTNTIPVDCDFPDYQYLSETWAFHDRCGTWEQIATGNAPPARGRHMMAYDKTGHQMLMFGGRCCRVANGGSVNYTLYNDLWALDLDDDTWSQLNTNTGPSARDNASLVVAAPSNKAFLFGGNLSTSGLAYNVVNELWQLDLAENTWSQLSPTGTPPSARLWVAGTYDSERNRLIFYGGDDEDAFFGSDSLGDLWAYNIDDNTWIQLHDGFDVAPAGRFWTRITYDTVNDRYLMFGGHDDTNLGNTNEIWAFDPQNFAWQQLRPGDTYNKPAIAQCQFPPDFSNVDMQAPERRNGHAMTWSTREGCPGVLAAMGKTDCGATDDVWRWRVDNDEWEELDAAREGEMCLRADRGFDCAEMCE